jgi:glutamate 5-kinase
MHAREALQARRLTVKVGSALLVQPDGELRRDWLDGLAADIADLHGAGRELIVVTSGAIALGWRRLGMRKRPVRLDDKQAAAAAGQIVLARAWQDSLAARGLTTAQILVTLDDTEARRRYLNARATMAKLLEHRAVPIVNENDTVATGEIRFGDNDRLSARVAVMASAETLVLLSDIDGLYTADPRSDPSAVHVPVVEAITPEIVAMAGGSVTSVGTGGMVTKLAAASIATGAGCSVLLTRGTGERPLTALEAGARCTVFVPRTNPRRARTDWIAGSLGAMGTVVVDDGAAGALRRGSSLLPAGVRAIEGNFERGDAVLIKTLAGTVLAKGLCAYDADEARLLAGRRTDEIEAILGWRGRDVLVHRDDLVLL